MEADPLLIEKMIDVLQTNQMPPEGQKQVRADQRQKLLQVLRRSLQNAITNVAGDNRFRMRRMNRFEYGNAVRDLFDPGLRGSRGSREYSARRSVS